MQTNQYKDLLWELIKTNFKLRYNNSVLGFLWVLIKPFATFVILYTVWTAFKGGSSPNYQVYLLLGIVLFTFVNEAVIFGMNGLLDKSHIILKVNFPREIAVMSSVTLAFINLMINMVIFTIFGFLNPITPTALGTLWFFVTVMVVFLGIYGLDLFLSIMLIKLRDLQHIFELLFQLLFWATPIFYKLGEQIPYDSTVGMIISLNPLGMFIDICRVALIEGKIATLIILNHPVNSIWVVLGFFIIAVLLIITGRIYFNRNVKKIAEYF